jgi:hypothetical protein
MIHARQDELSLAFFSILAHEFRTILAKMIERAAFLATSTIGKGAIRIFLAISRQVSGLATNEALSVWEIFDFQSTFGHGMFCRSAFETNSDSEFTSSQNFRTIGELMARFPTIVTNVFPFPVVLSFQSSIFASFVFF